MRSPYQVLVFPYYIQKDGGILYAIFKRHDLNVWQAIAGGGEEGETPLGTAKREAFEEAGISTKSKITQLSSVASIPVIAISGFIWGDNTIVIPEYSFGVELRSKKTQLNDEHPSVEWLTYEEAVERLKWDSNRTALWELDYRIKNKKL